jgi:APA family basic amino acid/polyamine antiporter
MSGHFARKPLSLILSEAEDGGHSLKRSLSALNLILLGVGGIIGAGIFVLTGQASAMYAGPAIIISFILSGIACAFAALCYAELAAMIPIAGSAYTYAFATMGRLMAWIIGWDLILEYLFGAAAVSVGWSGYVVSFLKDLLGYVVFFLNSLGWTGDAASIVKGLGVENFRVLTSAPYNLTEEGQWVATGSYVNLPAVLVNLIMTAVLIVGIRESANFNNLIVLLKCGVLLLFIGFGFQYINPANLTPFIPENLGEFGQYGWSGIFRGAGVIFFAYIGFDGVSTLAQEAKNPQRDMPIGIIGSLIVSTIFYIAVAVVLTGVVHYSKLNVPDPIAVAVNEVGEGLFWLRPIIKFGAIAGLSSVVLVMLMSQPRIFYSMAKDGFLPPFFANIHPKYKTPHITTLLCGLLSAVISGFVPIAVLGELVSIGTLLAFVIVCLGVLILRKVDPSANRPFKTPYVTIVSTLGALSALAQMLSLPFDTWMRLIIWMALGLLIYVLYGRKHSVVQ